MNVDESQQTPKISNPSHVDLLSLKFWVIFAVIAAAYFLYAFYLSKEKPETVKESMVTPAPAAP
jgi:hypothetical protein